MEQLGASHTQLDGHAGAVAVLCRSGWLVETAEAAGADAAATPITARFCIVRSDILLVGKKS